MDSQANKDIKPCSHTEFIDRIVKETRQGWGVVPFTGSGISARSGILMGMYFNEYLTWMVFRCVADVESLKGALFKEPEQSDGKAPAPKSDKTKPSVERWRIREHGWGRPPTPRQSRDVAKWVLRHYTKSCEWHGFKVETINVGEKTVVKKLTKDENKQLSGLDAHLRRPLLPGVLRKWPDTTVDDNEVKAFLRLVQAKDPGHEALNQRGFSLDSQEAIIEQAIRSLHDWKAMLEFLAKLGSRQREGGDVVYPCLVERDPSVIDGFNLHITRGRKPNLTHTMLCHLANPLRVRAIMTTNFDTLQEEAFEQHDQHFEVIPVSIRGDLPSPDTVHSLNCIVKLHGALTETRADYSLDDPASPEDKDKFFHYVAGRFPPPASKLGLKPDSSPGFLPKHLLICGYSGNDARCVDMLKHVLNHSEHTKVFWICFNDNDVAKIKRLFPEESYWGDKTTKEEGDGDQKTKTTREIAMTATAPGKEPRIFFTKSERPDLLLLELYQKLTLRLPQGGFSYQYSHDVPPDSWEPDNQEDDAPHTKFTAGSFSDNNGDYFKELCDKITQRPLKWVSQSGTSRDSRDFLLWISKSLENISAGILSKIEEVSTDKMQHINVFKSELAGHLNELINRRSLYRIAMWWKIPTNPETQKLASSKPRGNSKEIRRLNKMILEDYFAVQNQSIRRLLNVDANWRSVHHLVDAVRSDEKPVKPVIAFINEEINGVGEKTTFKTGLLAILKQALNRLQKTYDYSVIWAEMEEFADPLDVLHYVLQVISLRLGFFQLEHSVKIPGILKEARAKPQDKTKVLLLLEAAIKRQLAYFTIDPKSYVIFFYGRNIPGSCSGWKGRAWNNDDYECFHLLLKALSKTGFRVVYAPLTEGRVKDYVDKEAKFKDMVPNSDICSLKDRFKDDIYFEEKDVKSDHFTQPKNYQDKNECKEYYAVYCSTEHDKKKSASITVVAINSIPAPTRPGKMEFSETRFIFAATLFRRARPLNVFLNEPLIAQNHAGNLDGFDNDWDRWSQAETWLQKYQGKPEKNQEAEGTPSTDKPADGFGIFWRKPGGNHWLYRDTRLGLKLLLGYHRIDGTAPDNSSRKQDSAVYFGHLSSWYHCMIAKWYFRAFCTTDHAMPLCEALHHLFQCVCHLPIAMAPHSANQTLPVDPSSQVDQSSFRRNLWIQAVSEWIKYLRVGRASILFWMDPLPASVWFGDEGRTSPKTKKTEIWGVKSVLDKVGEIQNDLWPNLKTTYKDWPHAKSLFDELQAEMTACALELKRKPFQPRATMFAQTASMPPDKSSTSANDAQDSKGADMEFWPEPQFYHGNNVSWRSGETGTRRNACLANDVWKKIFDGLGQTDTAATYDTTAAFTAIKGSLEDYLQNAQAWRSVPEIVTVFNELSYEHIRRAKIVEDAQSFAKNLNVWRVVPSAKESRGLWGQVCLLARLTLVMCDYIPPAHFQFDLHQRVTALSYYGLALAHLGRFSEAHRRLNEAAALLSKVPQRGTEAKKAFLKLRRAEIHFLEAKQLRILKTAHEKVMRPNQSELENNKYSYKIILERCQESIPDACILCHWLGIDYDSSKVKNDDRNKIIAQVEQLTKRYRLKKVGTAKPEDDLMSQEFDRLICAKVDDAWVAIESAERSLAGRTCAPQSWGRFCALKLQILALFPKTETGKYRTLTSRRRTETDEELDHLIHLGFAVWPDEPFRKMRLLDYFIAAKEANLPEGERRCFKKYLSHEILFEVFNNQNKAKVNLFRSADGLAGVTNEEYHYLVTYAKTLSEQIGLKKKKNTLAASDKSKTKSSGAGV